MKLIKQLNNFMQKGLEDDRLLPSHISLYLAIASIWCDDGTKDVIKVFRKQLMQLAHINSLATYHKCMKQLDEFGYLSYRSSYNHYKGCEVKLS